MINKNKTAMWHDFAARNQLTDGQLQQFKLYASMVQEWNEYFNLTALTDTDDIIEHHFQDSIEVAKYIDISKNRMIADVGTGAGFPAIPLKIMYPDMPFVLIEVNQKKVKFLQTVLDALGLTGDEFVTDDWRTFLRHGQLPIDLFLARASLQPEELLRIFKGQSFYKQAQMIYWASQHWQASNNEKKYIQKDEVYAVGGKKRRYVIFADKQ